MKTIIHIGFPKSASSSLQHLWLDTTTAYFAGKRPRRSGQRFVDDALEDVIRRRITFPQSADFDLPRARAVADRVKELAAAEGKDTVLISAEGLAGVPMSAYGTQRAPFEVIAQRLAAMWGENSSVFMVVREQRAFLKSFHSHLVEHGYTTSFATFVDKCLGKVKGLSVLDGPLPGLRYDVQIKAAEEAGLSTSWLPFEALISDPSALRWVLDHSGIHFEAANGLPHVNKGRSPKKLEAQIAAEKETNKAISKLDAREMVSVLKLEERKKRTNGYSRLGSELSNLQIENLNNFFAPHNSKLSHESYPLSKYGYALI